MKAWYFTKQAIIVEEYMYEIFKNKRPTTTPLQVENILDLGYLGVKSDFPTVKYVLPFRKKRKSELSDEEKKYNKRHSKLRVIVEHTVSRIKKFGIMGIKFRNKLGRYDHASDIVSLRTSKFQNNANQ